MSLNYKPYRFDRSFAEADVESVETAVIEPTFTALDVDRARRGGIDEGRRLAGAEESAVSQRRIADSLASIVGQLTALHDNLVAANGHLAQDAAMVALAVCRRLLPARAVQEFGGEVTAAVTEVVRRLPTVPRLTVQVGSGTHEAVADRLAALVPPETELRVTLDATMGDGECRIAWADGELLLSLNDRWRAISEVAADVLGVQLPVDGDLIVGDADTTGGDTTGSDTAGRDTAGSGGINANQRGGANG